VEPARLGHSRRGTRERVARGRTRPHPLPPVGQPRGLGHAHLHSPPAPTGGLMNQPGGHDARYVLGIDFGTLSGRAVVVRVSDGAEVGSAVHPYRHGVIDTILPDTG